MAELQTEESIEQGELRPVLFPQPFDTPLLQRILDDDHSRCVMEGGPGRFFGEREEDPGPENTVKHQKMSTDLHHFAIFKK